jgi:endonuclease YncB( thermonuclease family)
MTARQYSVIRVCATLFLCAAAPAGARDDSGDWEVFERARLITHRHNDGDSFHVKLGKREAILRLYFVDAAETDASIPERLQEQAEYWDVDTKRALELGSDAGAFTADFLRAGFTVYTRWADARGRSEDPRYYAMIRVGDAYLSEALVRAGLARVYGQWAAPPDGRTARAFHAVLKAAEKAARRDRAGGWGGMRVSSQSHPVPPVEQTTRVLTRKLGVYSDETWPRFAGFLPPGTRIWVRDSVAADWVRIAVDTGDGTYRTLQCRREALGP